MTNLIQDEANQDKKMNQEKCKKNQQIQNQIKIIIRNKYILKMWGTQDPSLEMCHIYLRCHPADKSQLVNPQRRIKLPTSFKSIFYK